MEDSKKDKKNDIEIISGNGDEIEITSVYSHIKPSKPKTDKKTDKKIVVPKECKKK